MRKKLHKFRLNLMIKSEKWHGTLHLIFGILAFLVCSKISFIDFEENKLKLLAITILGSFLPDFDHVLYIFGYGRKKKYAIEVRKLIYERNFKGLINYIKQNHKHNTGIYSHNIGTVLIVMYLTSYELFTQNDIYMTAFFLAWSFHYLFDIFEDLIFFKKLNKNWFFIFNKETTNPTQ